MKRFAEWALEGSWAQEILIPRSWHAPPCLHVDVSRPEILQNSSCRDLFCFFILLFVYFIVIWVFCGFSGAGDWTQVLQQAKHALYHWAMYPVPRFLQRFNYTGMLHWTIGHWWLNFNLQLLAPSREEVVNFLPSNQALAFLATSPNLKAILEPLSQKLTH